MKIKVGIISAAAVAVAAAVYFTFAACRERRQESGDVRLETLQTAADSEQAAQIYFSAFAKGDGGLYLTVMPKSRIENQRRLFDGEKELYDCFAVQFDDERDYLAACFGKDYKLNVQITDKSALDESDYSDCEALSAERLEVSVTLKGNRTKNVLHGALTAVETDDGWYIYDTDFEKIFW